MKKRKIHITFFKKEKDVQRVFNIDKSSLELYAEMMRDRHGKI